jgi:cytochrome P450
MPRKSLPPGDASLPIIGDTFALLGDDLIDWALDHYRRLGPIWRSRMLLPTNPPKSFKVAVLLGPDAHRWAMIDHWADLSWHDGYQFLNQFFAQGILTSDGEDHALAVQTIAPVFHQRHQHLYLRDMLRISEWHLRAWGEGTVSLGDPLQLLTLALAEHMLFGGGFDAETCLRFGLLATEEAAMTPEEMADSVNQRFRDLWRTFSAGLMQLPWSKSYKAALRVMSNLDAMLDVLVRREQGFIADGQTRMNVTAQFMRMRNAGAYRPTDEGVMSQDRQLMFAGHATTQITVNWILAHLAQEPDWQQRLRRALTPLIDTAAPNLQDLAVPEADAFIRECIRLHSMKMMFRLTTRDLFFGDYCIPQGWLVVMLPCAAHRLPEYFTDPDRFDPERFLPPRSEDQCHPYAFIGFGEGKRGCIGEQLAMTEMKCILAKALQFYTFQLDPTYSLLHSGEAPPLTLTPRMASADAALPLR